MWAAIARKEVAPAAEAAPVQDDQPKRIAIVDANAIMKGLRLEGLADKFCTVQEVLSEVRDKQSRQFLATLPYTIEVQEPSEESVKAVQRFARETGDAHALSAADVKLLALAHTLEMKAHGTAHLREHPVQASIRPKHRSKARPLPGWGNVANPEDWAAVDAIEDDPTHGTSRIRSHVQALDITADAPQAPGVLGQQAGSQQLTGAGAASTAAADAVPAQPPSLPFSSFGAAAAAALAAAPSQADVARAQFSGLPSATAAATAATASAQQQGSMAGTEDGSDEEEEEDEWCTAGKSRNSERRRRRQQQRWEARQAAIAEEQAAAQEELSKPAAGLLAVAGSNAVAGAAGGPGVGAAGASGAPQGSGEAQGSGEDEDDDEEEEEGSEEGSEEEGEGEEGEEEEDEETEEVDRSDTAEATGTDCGEVAINTSSSVVSVTGDFPMQNVLLQMGLRLVAGDGRQITRLSRWALRCAACFFVTKEAGRLFCPRCGNMTMERVEISVGADGAEVYGVRKKHVLRGTRFSLPKPKGGRARNLILREDQLLKKLGRNKKKDAAALDPFAPEYNADNWHAVNARNTQQLADNKGAAYLMAGWKHNPNERKKTASNRRRK